MARVLMYKFKYNKWLFVILFLPLLLLRLPIHTPKTTKTFFYQKTTLITRSIRAKYGWYFARNTRNKHIYFAEIINLGLN